MFKQMSFAISRKHSDTTVRPNKIKKRNVSCAISHRAPRVTADLHGLASKSFLHVLFKVSLEGDIWFHINTLSNKTICEHEPRCLSLSPRACTPQPPPSRASSLSQVIAALWRCQESGNVPHQRKNLHFAAWSFMATVLVNFLFVKSGSDVTSSTLPRHR